MKNGTTIRAIRENLQVITSAEETTGKKISDAVKRIDRLLDRLEAEISCPLEKECPRIGKKGHA